MKNIYLEVPQLSMGMKQILLALIISIIFIFSIVNKFNLITVIVIILFSLLILIFMDSATGTNLVGSLPFATYPNPPHLGLDGVSNENRASTGPVRSY